MFELTELVDKFLFSQLFPNVQSAKKWAIAAIICQVVVGVLVGILYAVYVAVLVNSYNSY